jgi:hypothetical protein
MPTPSQGDPSFIKQLHEGFLRNAQEIGSLLRRQVFVLRHDRASSATPA